MDWTAISVITGLAVLVGGWLLTAGGLRERLKSLEKTTAQCPIGEVRDNVRDVKKDVEHLNVALTSAMVAMARRETKPEMDVLLDKWQRRATDKTELDRLYSLLRTEVEERLPWHICVDPNRPVHPCTGDGIAYRWLLNMVEAEVRR